MLNRFEDELDSSLKASKVNPEDPNRSIPVSNVRYRYRTEDPNIWSNLALCLADLGRADEALEAVRTAQKLVRPGEGMDLGRHLRSIAFAYVRTYVCTYVHTYVASTKHSF